MEWKDLASKITEMAPILGGAIGGPGGTAIGLAISALARMFGLKSDAAPEEVEKAIQQDPQALLKLRLAEMDYRLALGQQKLEETEAYLKDVQSARQREVDVTKITGRREWNQYLTAWTVIIGFFALCGILMRIPLPTGSSDVVFMLFGALATGFGTVLNYFFGSSKGSAEKNVLLTQKS